MDEDLWETLLRFHREVMQPDFERILRTGTDSWENQIRVQMRAEFARLHLILDNFKTAPVKP